VRANTNNFFTATGSIMPSAIEDQIKAIEDEIFNTPKNKATERHIGKLKAKIARLRDELREEGTKRGGGRGYAIKKSGDATVGIIGFPNVGKSTLLNRLTNAKSDVGDYAFTTVSVIPGMMEYKGAKIQILDLPGLIRGSSSGAGRGKEILAVVRSLDMILLMIDARDPDQFEIIRDELWDAGIRTNETPPDITIKRKDRGGIAVYTTASMDKTTIKAIASEYVLNADVVIRGDVTERQLIDYLAGNRVYVPSVLVANKMDLMGPTDNALDLPGEWGQGVIPISAKNGEGLDELRAVIFRALALMRIYLRREGNVDEEPLILNIGSTVGSVCDVIHRDMRKTFRHALVWGKSVRYPGQMVGIAHVLDDGDVLTIV